MNRSVKPVDSAHDSLRDTSKGTVAEPEAGKRLKSASRRQRLISALLAACVFGYLAAVAGVWLLLWRAGDQWWLATLATFGPRWAYALPLLVLVPPVLAWRRALIWPLAAAAVVVFGPIMGLCVPWESVRGGEAADLRVLTFNVEGDNVSQEEFEELLAEVRPAVVAVQEYDTSARWRLADEWHVAQAGDLMIVSRFPIERIEVSRCAWPPRRHPDVNGLYCVLATPHGRVGFCNVHLDTPRKALGAVLSSQTVLNLSRADEAAQRIEYRRRESADLAAWIEGFEGPTIVAGDFNMPVDSLIYRRYWSGFRNAFSRSGLGYGYTKITMIRRVRFGTRIDHVLASSTWRPARSWLGPRMGSDHRPLVAELSFTSDAGSPRTAFDGRESGPSPVAQRK